MPKPAPSLTNCWICGNTQKLTREHFPKKADTRRYMKSGRLFRHTATRRNERIQGASSKSLYLGAPICEACNTSRTQQHDYAWDALRDYMLDNWPVILAAGELDLKSVYGAAWATRGVDLQLYFVKVLGCAAVLEQIPIAVQLLRDALLNGTAHPHLFLMLSDSKPPAGKPARAMLAANGIETVTDRVFGGNRCSVLAIHLAAGVGADDLRAAELSGSTGGGRVASVGRRVDHAHWAASARRGSATARATPD